MWGGEPSLLILLYLTLVHRRLLCLGLNGERIDDLKLSDSVYNKQGGPGETIACQICCFPSPWPKLNPIQSSTGREMADKLISLPPCQEELDRLPCQSSRRVALRRVSSLQLNVCFG